MTASHRFRLIPIALAMFFPVQSALPADSTQSERSKFVKHTFGPTAVARSAASAGIEQGFNTPSEWGHGAEGFGKRFASAFGHHILKKGIEYPMAKLLHEQYGYRVSDKTGVNSRMLYALTAVVITHKTTDGSRTVNGAELSSSIGSGLLSRLWQPASTRTIGAGFGSAGTTLAVDAGVNVLREFWPEIRHPHSHATVRAAVLAKQRTALLQGSGKTVRPVATRPFPTESEESDRENENQ